MDKALAVLVPIFTCITLLSKWHRSSSRKKNRWLGFVLQSIPIAFWLFYFTVTRQPWICVLTISNAFFVIRGVLNNKAKGGQNGQTM